MFGNITNMLVWKTIPHDGHPGLLQTFWQSKRTFHNNNEHTYFVLIMQVITVIMMITATTSCGHGARFAGPGGGAWCSLCRFEAFGRELSSTALIVKWIRVAVCHRNSGSS